MLPKKIQIGGLLFVVFITTFSTSLVAQTNRTIFYDVNIIDIETGKVLNHSALTVEENKIISVIPISKFKIPKNSILIKASGKYIVPGFWDMHVHVLEDDFPKWQFPLFLANGMIGFREMWGDRPLIDSIRTEIQKGTMPHFHFTASGHIMDGKKVFWEGSLSAKDSATAIYLVDSLADAKVDFIKIYSFLEPKVFNVVAKRCQERKIRFVGHVPHRVWLTEASNSGMETMEHLYGFLVEACSFPDSAMKMKRANADDFEMGTDPKRRIEKARYSEAFMLANFSEARMRNICKVLKKNNTYIVPTVVANRGGYFSNDSTFTNDSRLKYLTQAVKDEWKEETEKDIKKNSSEDWQNKRKRYEVEKRMINILWQEKVPILAGTDSYNPYAFPGFSLHDEMALFVEFGMTPLDALRTATLNPVEYLHMSDSLGTIEAGKKADLVLLNNNPLDNIKNTSDIFGMMLNGKFYSQGELEKLRNSAIKK